MMKVTVVHDDKGHISELVAFPADAPPAYPQAARGLVTIVEDPDLDVSLGPKKISERLAHLQENFRVETGGTKPKFTAKR
jgi:hypothetical protein